MHKHRTRAAGSLAAAILALAAPVAAQKSDAEIRREIVFARGLAADWTFVDLAEQVLREVEKAGVSSRMATELALARCEVFAIGAENARTPERRNELFELALQAYERFLREFPQSDRKDEAESGFVGVSAKYARSLGLSLEDAVGEQADALRKRQQDVLSAAVNRTGDLIADLKQLAEQEEAAEADKRKLYDLMLDRGRMLLDIARTQEDGSFNFEQSMATLEDLVFTAGEGTPYALRAYAAMGENLAARGRWEEAATYFEEVVNQAIPIDRDEWRKVVEEGELTQGDKELRWLFVQLGTQGLIEALLGDGRATEAVRWALHLYNTQRREGFSYQPIGYLSLLAGARALLDAGGWIGGSITAGEAQWFATAEEVEAAGFRARDRSTAIDLALRIAETVNRDNPGNTLKVRAQRLISQVIDRPGVEVAPDVLFEAAMGAYNEREHREALDGFRRVLRAVDGLDEATQLLYAPKTLYHVGRSLNELDRPLEAAVAFQEACTRYRGDPEFDEKNAQGFYTCARQLASAVKGDETIQGLLTQAQNLVAEIGTSSAGLVLYRQAEQLKDEKRWAEAQAKYRAVPESEPDHEKALVFSAYCELRLGNADAALSGFTDYLERYVKDPAKATTSPARLQRRQEARAAATFYRAYIVNERAAKGEAGWQEVIDLLDGFAREFPAQTDIAPFAERMVVLAHLALGQTDLARERLTGLIQAFPEDKHTGFAAIKFYTTLEERLKQAKAQGDLAKERALLREMAELMRLSNDTDPTPDWPNLRRESGHWLELGEHAEAERVLKKILALFSADPGDDEATRKDKLEHAVDLEKYVKPDLAHALLEQQKTSEALALLETLVAGTDARPTKAVATAFARAVFGGVEGAQEPFTVVPGAGAGEPQFQKASDFLVQIAASVEKYSCDWIELKFDLAYAYYVWGQKDSRKLDSARAQIGPMEQDFGAGFDEVETRCREEGDAPRGQALRRRFMWLRDKLK